MLTTPATSVIKGDFSEIIMQVPALIAVLEGPEHIFVLTNHLYQQVAGHGRSLIGKPIREALPELEGQGIFDLLDNVYNTGVAYKESELPVLLDRNDDGGLEEVFFTFVYQPIRDKDNVVTGIFVHAIDVTDYVSSKKKLERSEEQFRSFVMHSPVPTGIYVGRDMVIQMANDALLQTWDKTADVIGKTFREALPELEGQPFYDLLDKVFTTGESYQAMEDQVLLFRNGKLETTYYNFTYKALKDEDGKIWGVMNTGVEVTEIVEAKNKIKRAEEDLEQQVKLRTIELEKLNTDLTHTNEQLRQFAYVASHDLQEPLRKINIYSDRLATDLGKVNKEEQQKYLNKIITSANRMSNLIRDLLNFTRLDSVQESFVSTNLNHVADMVKEDFEILISQKSALITIGQLGTIEANPLQMNQLMSNLLGNALKFSKENERPVIDISSKLLTKEEVAEMHSLDPDWEYREIIVADQGIGFDPQYARQVFVIFQRLNGAGRFEGTGIGLAVCKKIVDHHHGEIFAISKEGEGSAFHIILPVARC
ncbi:MAG: PAS domain-containing protein [Chitinophagaceae bacterium]|nr:PAS domain-containing protein [Chitinophagaceae bacterium]